MKGKALKPLEAIYANAFMTSVEWFLLKYTKIINHKGKYWQLVTLKLMTSAIKVKRQVTNSDNIPATHNQQRIRIKIKLRISSIPPRKKKQSNRKIGKGHKKSHFIKQEKPLAD